MTGRGTDFDAAKGILAGHIQRSVARASELREQGDVGTAGLHEEIARLAVDLRRTLTPDDTDTVAAILRGDPVTSLRPGEDGMYRPGGGSGAVDPVEVDPLGDDDPSPRRRVFTVRRFPWLLAAVVALAVPVMLVRLGGRHAAPETPRRPSATMPASPSTVDATSATAWQTVTSTAPGPTTTATATATATLSVTRRVVHVRRVVVAGPVVTRVVAGPTVTAIWVTTAPPVTRTVTTTRTIRATVTRRVRAASTPACAPIRPGAADIIAGQEIDTFAFARRCGTVVHVDSLASSTVGAAYRIVSVEVWRYAGRSPSTGPVRSAVVPVDRTVSRAHVAILGRRIPARAVGRSGFVRVTLATAGGVRTITLTV